jgi:hypothetical protein
LGFKKLVINFSRLCYTQALKIYAFIYNGTFIKYLEKWQDASDEQDDRLAKKAAELLELLEKQNNADNEFQLIR